MFSNLLPCISFKDESDNQRTREPLIDTAAIPKWRLLYGENHWKGLLRPLDIDLRRHLIHYGEMAQATNDAFNRDKHSEFAGRSRYSKKDFFKKVGLENKNRPYKYKVTRFIYATSAVVGVVPEGLIVAPLSREGAHAVTETNWMGYVAVAEDESVEAMGRRDVVVAWRGSVQALEWISDFMVNLVAAPEVLGRRVEEEGEQVVHKGFHSIYTLENPHSPLGKTSARQQVLEEIKRVVEKYKEEEISITVTGHSLGAALATLNAVDIVTNNLNLKPNSGSPIPVTAILFGSPKVGSSTFKRIFSEHESQGVLRALRVENAPDVVPKVFPVGYSEVGDEVEIDTRKSKYLKKPGSFKNWHNLEVYLHGVAGDQMGKWWRNGFRLVVERDISLVNKVMENLKGEYGVPVGWWVDQNKGMVQKEDGSWLADGYDDQVDEDQLGL